MCSINYDRQQIASLGILCDLLLALCRRTDGLARHIKNVGLPHAAYAALYRATEFTLLTVPRLLVSQPYKRVHNTAQGN